MTAIGGSLALGGSDVSRFMKLQYVNLCYAAVTWSNPLRQRLWISIGHTEQAQV